MNLSRRQFLNTTAALAAVASGGTITAQSRVPTTGAAPDFRKIRADFPWLKNQVYLTGADRHPFGNHSIAAYQSYVSSRADGPAGGGSNFTGAEQQESKELFAKLINAKPAEIAFVSSTTDAENLVVSGMELARTGGNVVIDDLHYQASKYMYRMLARDGKITLKIVPHRNWKTHAADYEKAIDRETRLVSLALVSNINGYVADVKAISDIAHARGAIVYGDIIQGAGASPIDVQAMGIDCAGCGGYKWLMGDGGFGFLYVSESKQGDVVRRSRWGVRQRTAANQSDAQFEVLPGAAMFEAGSIAAGPGLCTLAGLRYLTAIGVDNIRAHARTLTDRLQDVMPRLGYPAITPRDNPSPIVSFLTPNPEDIRQKLARAVPQPVVALRRWEFTNDATGKTTIEAGVRISPSVYNNQEDIDRLLHALGRT